MSRAEIDIFLFFNDTATTEIYTLSLHDALPIYQTGINNPTGWLIKYIENAWPVALPERTTEGGETSPTRAGGNRPDEDRKSTRLNSSHANISYAVFCLKKTFTPFPFFFLLHLHT